MTTKTARPPTALQLLAAFGLLVLMALDWRLAATTAVAPAATPEPATAQPEEPTGGACATSGCVSTSGADCCVVVTRSCGRQVQVAIEGTVNAGGKFAKYAKYGEMKLHATLPGTFTKSFSNDLGSCKLLNVS